MKTMKAAAVPRRNAATTAASSPRNGANGNGHKPESQRRTSAGSGLAAATRKHERDDRFNKSVDGLLADDAQSRLIPLAHLFRSATNREYFDEAKMAELVASVREHGVMEPIIVRPVKAGDWFVEPVRSGGKDLWQVVSRGYVARLQTLQQGDPPHPLWSQFIPPHFKTQAEAEANLPRFEIVMGERRYRAAREVGLTEIPAIVRELDDKSALEWQLTENLMREDLRPVDEGRGFKQLMDLGNTIEEIAAKVNVGKSTIYARMKLLELPAPVLQACETGVLPASHAELLSKIEDPKRQERLATQMLKPKDEWAHGGSFQRDLSFREAKALVDEASKAQEKEKAWREKTADYRDEGCQVLTIEQSAKVFQYGSLKAGYVGASDKCDLDAQGRTWKALLTKIGEEGGAIVAHNDYGTGDKVRIVYARKKVEKLLIDSKLVTEKAAKVDPAEQRRREEEARKEKEARQFARDCAAVEKLVAGAEAREFNADVLRFVASEITRRRDNDRMLQRRGLAPASNDYSKKKAATKKLLEGADGKTLRGIVVETLLWEWRGLDPEASKALGAILKVKVQASGKGSDEAED